ncbi:MAG: vWA domain-containing protein, partial [Verrucomicrobiota bacterium]
PLTVDITNPNGADTWIMVSVNGAAFTQYSSAVNVEAGVVVSAYIDGDPENWITSTTVSTSFTVENYQLAPPSLTTSDPQFQSGVEEITVTLTNPNPSEISGLVYQLDSGTQIVYDGPFVLERGNHPDGVTVYAKAIGTDSFALESSVTTGFIANQPDPLEKPLIGLSATEFNDSTPTIVATLSNTNPAGSSQILYAVIAPGGTFPPVSSWSTYSGAISLEATNFPDGFTIRAYTDSLNESLYTDSEFAEATTTAFFDVPISDDVLFVIDSSGSMDSEFNDGTRFEAVIGELIRTIPTLPDSIKFGVAMFDSGIEWVSTSDNLFTMIEPDPDTLYAMGVDLCQHECDAVEGYVLIDATEENKAAMISAVQSVTSGGGTNYEVGLRFAVQFDPMPGQVIFLSDGRPNSGDYPGGSWPDEVEDLAELGIRVDTIGMQLGDDELGNLEWIAGTTGGTLTILEEGFDDDLDDNNGLLDEAIPVPDGSAFSADSYPLTITLTNPNVFDLSSYIMYRIDGGTYQLYTGPITLSGPALIETYIDSNTQGMQTSDVGYDDYTLAP